MVRLDTRASLAIRFFQSLQDQESKYDGEIHEDSRWPPGIPERRGRRRRGDSREAAESRRPGGQDATGRGYSKIEGKPMMVFCHGTVGLQHASMAVYNAYCDRAPIYIVFGNILDAAWRRGSIEWYHSVQDAAAMVRDYTKWDDAPISLTHFAESAVRAYRVAMTPPTMPVLIAADAQLQELPIPDGAKLRIPKLTIPAPPQGDSAAVAEAAKLLVAAENPVIVTGRATRTPAGMAHLVKLAELLGAPVLDQGERMNFPTRHPLNHSDRARQA